MTYARAVKTSGDALLSLIEELLDYSKIEAGKIDLEHRPFALAALIEDITELLAPRAQARKLEIAAYVDERLPIEVVGDAARLRQVLLNLAGNAIKFTSTGGVALIVEPGIWPNEISFLVRDTGIGIAPEAQQRIFREFEQADERIARSYGGTGLGLSICERIVKRMGGRITLESKPDVGSTFEVSIPLAASDREGERAEGLRGAGSDRSVDHAGRAADHRGFAGRAPAATLGRRRPAWSRMSRWRRRCCPSDPGTRCCSIARWARPRSHCWARRRAPHATQRIVMFTPATRHEIQPSFGFHRLSGQAVARGFARGPPDDGAGNCRAESCRPMN